MCLLWGTILTKNLQTTLVKKSVTSPFLRIRGGIFLVGAEHDSLSKLYLDS